MTLFLAILSVAVLIYGLTQTEEEKKIRNEKIELSSEESDRSEKCDNRLKSLRYHIFETTDFKNNVIIRKEFEITDEDGLLIKTRNFIKYPIMKQIDYLT